MYADNTAKTKHVTKTDTQIFDMYCCKKLCNKPWYIHVARQIHINKLNIIS